MCSCGEVTRVLIQAYKDREAMVVALANSGYKVWVEESKKSISSTDYYVCFEHSRMII